jgi:Collagen triple helix repeat (20 copies)
MSVKRWNGTGWDTYAGAGVQGTAGSNGTQGVQGVQGTQGTQGTQGPQGTSGTNGTNGAQGTTGASGQFPATAVSSNITLAAFNAYMVDTTAARTLTLPASPTIGNEIHIFDATGSAATNNISVANNGSNINGQATSLTIDSNYAAVNLVYVGSAYGWRIS